MPKNCTKSSRKLILFLVVKSLLALVLIGISGIELAPDEAQYWSWSRSLDFGYYSKPPGIAWEIFFSTLFFGDTLLGVRFSAVLFSFFIALALFRMAKKGGLSEKVAFWAAVIFSLSPMGLYLTFAATTDAGAILGIIMAMGSVAEALYQKKLPNYYKIGLWIGFGALFKWVAFALWPFIFLFSCFYPFLRSRKIVIGLILSLAALLPSLYWNSTHDFATFKHVFATVAPKSHSAGNFFDFLISQVGLLSLFFVLFIMATLKAKHFSSSLLWVASLPWAVTLYLIASLFQKMQPNWALYLLPPAMVVTAWYALQRLQKGLFWLYSGIILSLAIFLGALSIPLVQQHYKIPYSANPFRQNMGWERIPSILKQAGYHSDTDFLFADKYQITSILSFYNPTKKRAYFFNLLGIRKNQFSYFPSMERERGKKGYFAVVENREGDISWQEKAYKEKLVPYFSEVHFCGAFPLFEVCNKPVKYLFLFAAYNYSGKMPPEKEKY